MKNIFTKLTRKQCKYLILFLKYLRLDYLGSDFIITQDYGHRFMYGEMYDHLMDGLKIAYNSEEDITTQKGEIPFFFQDMFEDFEPRMLVDFFKNNWIAYKENSKRLGYTDEDKKRVKKKTKQFKKAFGSLKLLK